MVEIYGLCDPRTGVVRYVGKSNNTKRRLRSHLWNSARPNTPLALWINGLKENGEVPIVKILERCREEDWPEREIAFIAKYRALKDSPLLLNLADGGNGVRNPVLAQRNRNIRDMCRRFVRCSDDELRGLASFFKDCQNQGRLNSAIIDRLRIAALVSPEHFSEWAL